MAYASSLCRSLDRAQRWTYASGGRSLRDMVTMRMHVGLAGWARFDDSRLPGALYVRWAPADTGRLTARCLHVETPDGIDAADIRDMPWREYESWANDIRGEITKRLGDACATNGMPQLAQAFSTVYDPGQVASDWVAAAYWSDFEPEARDTAGLGHLNPPKPARTRTRGTRRDTGYRLTRGPLDGLTDEFMGDLSRAYHAAVGRGERPNRAIYESLDGQYPIRTIERWVYLARQRGIMPPARKRGAAG